MMNRADYLILSLGFSRIFLMYTNTSITQQRYRIAGQKFSSPTPGYGDRVFYETLLRQRPESAMAQEWCVSYGVLPHDEAEKLNKKVTEHKRKIRMAGGAVAAPPVAASKPKKKKARVMREEAIDPDLVASGGDGVGRASL
jgi:hypothetical protein